MNSEEQQTTVEDKPSSPYYFFKSTDKELAQTYRPQKIETDAVEQASTPAVIGAPSTWNKGGTWEEQSVNDFALARLEALFVGVEVEDVEKHVKVSITSCDSVSGEASIVFSRGKKRCSFEMQAELIWSGTVNEKEVSGKISLPDMDFTNTDDFDIEVLVDDKSDADQIVARDVLRRKLPKSMYSLMKKFVEELLQWQGSDNN